MGVESAGVPQQEKGVVAPKPKEVPRLHQEGEGSALENAKKKWGAVDLRDADAKSKKYVEPILTEVRKELDDISKKSVEVPTVSDRKTPDMNVVMAMETTHGALTPREAWQNVIRAFAMPTASIEATVFPNNPVLVPNENGEGRRLVDANGRTLVENATDADEKIWADKLREEQIKRLSVEKDSPFQAVGRLVRAVVSPGAWRRMLRGEDLQTMPSVVRDTGPDGIERLVINNTPDGNEYYVPENAGEDNTNEAQIAAVRINAGEPSKLPVLDSVRPSGSPMLAKSI